MLFLKCEVPLKVLAFFSVHVWLRAFDAARIPCIKVILSKFGHNGIIEDEWLSGMLRTHVVQRPFRLTTA